MGTWNVNGQAAAGTELSDWLACDNGAPQLYVVGFQELDLSKEALVFADSPREEEWLRAVALGLHPGVYITWNCIGLFVGLCSMV